MFHLDANEVLKKAWEAVRDSGVPEALQETAFVEAVAILRGPSAGQPPGEPNAAAGQSPPAASPTHAPARAGTSGTYAKVAHETGVPVEDLQRVFHVDDAEASVKVLVPAYKLGTAKADQARSVVSIVAGAKHAGFDENQVSDKPVRQECQRMKCYDSSNFTKHVAALAGFNLRDDLFYPNAKWLDDFRTAIGNALDKTYNGDG